MVISIVITLKITRRKKGFKINPTDFLILFIAIFVPNIPGIKVMHAGIIVMKIIILMFGFEVLIGELRGEIKWLSGATAISIMIICIRGLLI
jgi:UDP-GlcNAc:undecaprenyl-phosphate GlcNAc-1-phosphate transferase